MKNFSAKGLGIIGSVVAAIVVIGAGIFWLLSSKGFDLSADNRQYAQILKIDMPRTTRYHLREPLRVVFSNNIAAAALLDGTAIRLTLFQPHEHIVHGIEKILIVLLDLHAGNHIYQRVHIAISGSALENDVGDQSAV